MNKRLRLLTLLTLVGALLITGIVLAEEGELFRHNISKTPDAETEKAAIRMMDFYVPVQSAAGADGQVDSYVLDDDDPLDHDDSNNVEAYAPRDYAKPLVAAYIDDIGGAEEVLPEGAVSALGGISIGHFDAFLSVSLDDGTSWKNTNLSRSADLSSFYLANGHAYPGDVHNVVHQVAGDRIFVAWVSKYCDGGSPLYTLEPDATQTVSDTVYLGNLEETYNKNALYLYDLFGVAGTQGSVNYTLQGFPDIGEIPYSCVWTARGKLIAGDDLSTTLQTEATHVVWTKPERLTSGTRDANLPAVDCAVGAGCMMTWQEDPEGLRPGQGLGPGEGWSGAIANAKTDIWYSYIAWDDFDDVFGVDPVTGAPFVPMEDYADGGMPKTYVPMAMPVRLTDNNMCKYDGSSDPYCYINFGSTAVADLTHSNITEFLAELDGPQDSADFCDDQYIWDTPDGLTGTTVTVCETEDLRVLNGRVASTRVRLNLKPYTVDDGGSDDTSDDIKSAWVVMAAEETKALGDVLVGDDVDSNGVCQEEGVTDPDCRPIDIGKDVWYYTFDIAAPYTLGMDLHIVEQGGMLNQPAQCKYDAVDDPLCGLLEEGDFYPPQTDPRGYKYYLSEIARRFALTTNSVSAAESAPSGLAAMLIYKQGIINQGGPADIFLRRVIIPAGFDAAVDNPYAFENMVCEYDDGTPAWVYREDDDEDGNFDNPNYLKGLCLSPAINISGSTIVDCGGDGTDNDSCAAAFPVLDDGSNPDGDQSDFPKIYEWRQLPYTATVELGDTFMLDADDDDSDLDDQSWDNPYDVAKGHRGFLDGDIVMMMYAWSPNWHSNVVGNDHYNLYIRRSFDGGLTWTTTPADLTDCIPSEDPDGCAITVTENYYGASIGVAAPVEFVYKPEANEQARNVSLLIGNKVTILDPRYTPTGGTKLYPKIRTDWLTDNDFTIPEMDIDDGQGVTITVSTLPYPDDAARDRSKYFIVYETGDNTTVAEGEAVPLDLFYSRAAVYGDVYETMLYVAAGDVAGQGVGDPYDAWPWLENKSDELSGEASILTNPGGTLMYAVWNQWREEILPDGHEHVYDSDIIFRRLLYLPDDTTKAYSPSASLLYVNQTMFSIATDDTVVMVGTARDFGFNAGIEEYQWWYKAADDSTSGLGVLVGSAKQLQMQTGQLPGQPGWAQFTFKASDKDGNWSNVVTVNALVAEQIFTTYMPMILR